MAVGSVADIRVEAANRLLPGTDLVADTSLAGMTALGRTVEDSSPECATDHPGMVVRNLVGWVMKTTVSAVGLGRTTTESGIEPAAMVVGD